MNCAAETTEKDGGPEIGSKANPECFDHDGRLEPGCFPARIPPETANLLGLMRRAECKLAMIRCHAECAIGKS